MTSEWNPALLFILRDNGWIIHPLWWLIKRGLRSCGRYRLQRHTLTFLCDVLDVSPSIHPVPPFFLHILRDGNHAQVTCLNAPHFNLSQGYKRWKGLSCKSTLWVKLIVFCLQYFVLFVYLFFKESLSICQKKGLSLRVMFQWCLVKLILFTVPLWRSVKQTYGIIIAYWWFRI